MVSYEFYISEKHYDESLPRAPLIKITCDSNNKKELLTLFAGLQKGFPNHTVSVNQITKYERVSSFSKTKEFQEALKQTELKNINSYKIGMRL